MVNIDILFTHVKYRATVFYLLGIILAYVKYTNAVFYQLVILIVHVKYATSVLSIRHSPHPSKIYNCSQTCVRRPLLGVPNGGCFRQVDIL